MVFLATVVTQLPKGRALGGVVTTWAATVSTRSGCAASGTMLSCSEAGLFSGGDVRLGRFVSRLLDGVD